MASIERNLHAAREHLAIMDEIIESINNSNFCSEKIRKFTQYIINSKIMYDKLMYACKEDDEIRIFYKKIKEERDDPESLSHYIKMARNVIEHGGEPPCAWTTELEFSAGDDGKASLFARTALASDLEMDVRDPRVSYSIKITEFFNNREKRTIPLPKRHRHIKITNLEMEYIVGVFHDTAVADFNIVWDKIYPNSRL